MSGSALILRADALRLPLPDESVDLIVSSPPYFALRSYRDGDEHYSGQIGSEPTPQAFLESLWAVMAECWRVLKPTGSCWINLGDKRAGSGGHNNTVVAKGKTDAYTTNQTRIGRHDNSGDGRENQGVFGRSGAREFYSETAAITGYSCRCGVPAPPTRPSVVLDVFGGTGTTAGVARALGRIGVSVDLSHDYSRLADWRARAQGVPPRARGPVLRATSGPWRQHWPCAVGGPVVALCKADAIAHGDQAVTPVLRTGPAGSPAGPTSRPRASGSR